MFYREVEGGYRLNFHGRYFSKRYGKWVDLEEDFFSDGATGAMDIFSFGWWVHDKLCNTGKWEDGSRLTNWQVSRVLADILWNEKRQFRAIYWLFATFFGGGGEARKNGMFRLRAVRPDESGTDITPA